MKNIYIMRHGETLFNLQHRTQGWCDSPLTERGIAEASRAGLFMKNFPVHFDAFFSSSSERACDTMELVFPGMTYIRLKGLKEMNFGAFEGHPQYLEVQDKSVFFAQFGGETQEQTRQRVFATLRSLFEQNTHLNHIFCVGHGGMLWAILKGIYEEPMQILSGIDNLDLLHFTFDEVTHEFKFVELIKTI